MLKNISLNLIFVLGEIIFCKYKNFCGYFTNMGVKNEVFNTNAEHLTLICSDTLSENRIIEERQSSPSTAPYLLYLRACLPADHP